MHFYIDFHNQKRREAGEVLVWTLGGCESAEELCELKSADIQH